MFLDSGWEASGGPVRPAARGRPHPPRRGCPAIAPPSLGRMTPVGRAVPVRDESTVAARLSDAVLAVFPELCVATVAGTGTTLSGPVIDRSHLGGLLACCKDRELDVADMHGLPE